MDTGSNKSLFTLIAVVIFGIFLSLSYWMFQDELKNVLADVMGNVTTEVDETVIGGNTLPLGELDFFPLSTSTYSHINGVFEYSSTGLAWSGLGITAANFEPNTTYSLTFTITKLSGNVTNLGGHSWISDYSEVYIDGVIMDGTWVSGNAVYPNDNLPHRVQVIFNTNRWEINSNRNLYIQPNRSHYEDYTKSNTVRVEDLSLIKH